MNKKELYSKVDKILRKEWDPISVKDCLGPDDEYRSYVPSIVRLLEENADEYRIAKLLHKHAKVNMGLSSNLTDHLEIASKLNKLTD